MGERIKSPSKGIAVSLITIKNKTHGPKASKNSKGFSETLQLQNKQIRQTTKAPEADLKV